MATSRISSTLPTVEPRETEPAGRLDDALGAAMPAEDRLSQLLSEFARNLLTDFPIQAILDHLVERIVQILPIDSAGVTLISPGKAPHYIAASDESALRYERLQTAAVQGPCLLAYESGEVVHAPDLARESRFPAFAGPAREAGLGAAFAFPLRHGDGRLGALDLYCTESGPLSSESLAAAQTLADVTAAYVLNAQARTEARAASDSFRHDALHDPLTGLPNRLLLQQRLEHAARRASRSHTNAAVLFADLDKFKQINDTYGHPAGDELLVSVAHRLSGLVRPGDTLARVSGDEFVFLCEDLQSAADIEVLATRIHSALATPFSVVGVPVGVTASVGMAYAGPGETITDRLIADADLAMYEAKRRGGLNHDVIDVRQTGLVQPELTESVTTNQLDLAYHPIVQTSDGCVTGMQASLRWAQPDRGPILVSDMLALVEMNPEVGEWLLRRACEQRGQWLRLHPGQPLDLAVAVSGRDVLGPHFTDTVATVLRETNMDPAAFILELAEDVLIHDAARATSVLTEIKKLGIRLELSDFGVGSCSLTMLLDHPIDLVKFAAGVISSIGTDLRSAAMVSAVSVFARQLGITVIADGVHTEAQRARLLELGCPGAQGDLFGGCLQAADVAGLLEAAGTDLRLPQAQ